MNRLWVLKGQNRKLSQFENMAIIAGPIEEAIEKLAVTHDEISFVRVDDLGKDWQ